MSIRFLPILIIASITAAASAAIEAPRTTERDEPAGSVVYPRHGTDAAKSLNGAWRFQLAAGGAAPAPDGFLDPAFDDSGWPLLNVPGHWDLAGFIEPRYAAPEPATGFYRTRFSVDEEWRGRRVHLRFEGVLYGFEAWLNGKPVGSWGSAYNPVTFDVTDLLDWEAENTLSVRATTESFANRFDQNDCWGLAGIYREVWLFALPEKHIRGWNHRTVLPSDGMAEVRIPVRLSGNATSSALSVSGTIVDAGGVEHRVAFSANQSGLWEGIVTLPRGLLWTAELPLRNTLRLALSSGGRIVHELADKIALREVRVDGPRLLVNGRPITLRGVDHHDIWPESGRVGSEAQIRRDLEMMLEANMNYVRTSHYPPDWRMLGMCEELGLFVMCEVPFGFGDKWLDDPAYAPELLARASATLRRDVHRGGIIIWSIGNENPITQYTVDTAKHVKALDPTRPVCFPVGGGDFFPHDAWKDIPPALDIYAPHYPSTAMAKETAGEISDRPVIFTEFAHQLALGGDGLQTIWDVVLGAPTLTGGAIWMFQDQGIIRRKTPTVQPHPYAVEKDEQFFFDTEGDRGADGLTYSDRVPKTNYWQARAVYAPVRLTGHDLAADGTLTLTLANHHDVRSLEGMTGMWSLHVDGTPEASGTFSSGLQPRASGDAIISLPSIALDRKRSAWMHLQIIDPEGRTVLIDSIKLRAPPLPADVFEADRETAEAWARQLIGGDSPAVRLRVGRKRGLVTSIWAVRQKKADLDWLPHLLPPNEMSDLTEERGDDRLRLTRAFTFVRGNRSGQSVAGVVSCEIDGRGIVRVDYDFEAKNAGGIWLEAGLAFDAPASAKSLRWIGTGPYPTYPGKNRLGRYGRHALHRDDLYFDGNRQDVAVAVLADPAGRGLALLPPKGSFNLSVENTGTGIVAGHNALVSSVGSKFTLPDVKIEPAKTPRLRGEFRVVLLEPGSWPEKLAILIGGESVPVPFHPYLEPHQ